MSIWIDGEPFGRSIGAAGETDRPLVEISNDEPVMDSAPVSNPVSGGDGSLAAGTLANIERMAMAGPARTPSTPAPRRRPPAQRPPLRIGDPGGDAGIGLSIWDFERRQRDAQRNGTALRHIGP